MREKLSRDMNVRYIAKAMMINHDMRNEVPLDAFLINDVGVLPLSFVCKFDLMKSLMWLCSHYLNRFSCFREAKYFKYWC